MKQILSGFLLIISLSIVAQDSGKTAINTFLDQWHLDATKADMPGLMNCFLFKEEHFGAQAY